ncbi:MULTISPECIES: hypothetical protein [Pseudomonas]|uniref:hypothetical protein n=1 Tax=Pseudomonas TaxID=286 RepID=UPI001AAE4865|nr:MULTISPECIES: hypothetical protein [Pseudomonas]MBO2889747.1 hypothetical protein [Pseudomonas asiatica]MCK2120156.1 hypothetical protein [Pseudomonas sp. PNPG3]MDN4495645.1 hypothetical protein [Pseudomonas mosselii]
MAFAVHPYTIANLIQCFVNGSAGTSHGQISRKFHRIYFEEYFSELKAKTIVVETDYIDKDYLEDYAAYYDRCFRDYDRRTHRLHFFDVDFSAEDFDACITATGGLSEQALSDGYLGFVVVKPLPQSIIGRTCLRTYPSDSGRRHFPSLRTYEVHLFGLRLEVHSLAYQEQDTVVAACATSALWSCFQGTGKLFQHQIPPPVVITDWAAEHMPENLALASARAFPNNGLTASQMAAAVRRLELEPMVISTTDRHTLNGVAYAFLKGKIPCVLAFALKEWDGEEQFSFMGLHAVAITGFSLSEAPPLPQRKTGFQLRAERIDRLYAHDDQVGPFARMNWCAASMVGPVHPSDMTTLKTSWPGEVFADIQNRFVMIPLYHKIRIPYGEIHAAVLSLDALIEKFRVHQPNIPRVEWDIYLTNASDYKASARLEYPALGIPLADTLYKSLPRFMWRVTVRAEDKVEMDLLFDATGIAQHDLLVHRASRGGIYQLILGHLSDAFSKHPFEVPPQVEAVLNSFAGTIPKP